MSKPTRRVCMAVACVAAVVIGAGGAAALSHSGPRARTEPPKGAPTDDAWLPKPIGYERTGSGPVAKASVPPTAFPALLVPVPERHDRESYAKREAALEKLCPRLRGKISLRIDPADDTLRKLLKARLHQCVLDYREHLWLLAATSGPGSHERPLPLELDWISSTLATIAELYAGKPNELVPWLEELLAAVLERERQKALRLEAGACGPPELYAFTQHRLKVEAELWKAKNPK